MEVTFKILGVRNAKGFVRGLVFSKEQRDGFPEDRSKAIAEAQVRAQAGAVELVFKNVPKGEACFSFFHDEKDLGRIEKNFLGIPKSGVGASNWSGLGRPSATKCLVKVSSQGQARLHYF